MEKVFVVKRVAEKLWATENTIDDAISDASNLLADLVTARKELKVGAELTDAATAKIIEAMQAMSVARRTMLEAHDALNEAQLRLGVRVTMDKPHPPVVTTPAETLEVRRAG